MSWGQFLLPVPAAPLGPPIKVLSKNGKNDGKLALLQANDFTMSHMLRMNSYNTIRIHRITMFKWFLNSDSPSFHPTRFKLQVAFSPLKSHVCYDPDSPIIFNIFIFFPKVPRRRQRMGCPMIRRHKDSCTLHAQIQQITRNKVE